MTKTNHCASMRQLPMFICILYMLIYELTYRSIKIKILYNKTMKTPSLNGHIWQSFFNSLYFLACVAVNMKTIIVGDNLMTSLGFNFTCHFYTFYLCRFQERFHILWNDPCLIIWPKIASISSYNEECKALINRFVYPTRNIPIIKLESLILKTWCMDGGNYCVLCLYNSWFKCKH